MKNIERLRLQKIYGFLYKRHMQGVNVSECFYCADLRQCLDHVPPISAFNKISMDYYRKNKITFSLIPCCNQCNGKLGDKLFLTVGERLEFLERFYETELRKIKARWTEDEITQLGRGLVDYIRAKKDYETVLIHKIRAIQTRAIREDTHPRHYDEDIEGEIYEALEVVMQLDQPDTAKAA